MRNKVNCVKYYGTEGVLILFFFNQRKVASKELDYQSIYKRGKQKTRK